MDSNIRKLIHAASQDNDLSALTEAYGKLRKERQSSDDKIDAVSSDLFVLCAETAFKHGQLDVMEDCIKMFFQKTPPSNQFLCRAYLCQAQLNAPTSSNNPEQLDKAVEYLLKAIYFAKKNPRYYFLVYNASVLYWQFCRPFLKPNYRQYLAKSLHQVVKALDDIDDKDYGWRAQLMIALIECHVDAGRKEDATQISIATLAFTKSNVPSLYTTVVGLQVRHQLIDLSKASKEARASNELYIFYKIQRLRTLVEADEKVDIEQELNKIYKSIVKGVDTTDRASTAMSTGTLTSKASSPHVVGSNDRIPLLIELGRLCLEHNKHELAADCIENLKGGVKSSDTLLEIEFMKCELMVKSLGEKKENYSKSVVERRIQAIRKLEQYIMTAIRTGNPNVIQAGCVTMWNLSRPLLQANLRHHVRKPLTLAAQALEDIDSLLVLLRCQIHTELAKCEEAEDQLEYAVTHLRKALEMDDSGQYYDRLQTALTRLQLRATLYKTPERPEDLAAMIIEQARASDDASTVRMKRASLVRAGEALSPDAFMLVLDGESNAKDPSTTKGPPTALGRLAGRAKQFEKGVSKAAGHLKRLGDENDQERVRIWADLAKTARKQQVWDVARVAARFCLLYDDNRWSKKNAGSTSEKSGDGVTDKDEPTEVKSPVPGEIGSKLDLTGMKLLHPEGMTPFRVEQDLLRTLAEVRFIFAEALVHLLRTEGVQLGDKPIPPEDTIKLRPKRYGDQPVNFDEIPEWVSYCEWISSLSNEVMHSFQRAAEIGVELKEAWLVCNAAVYLWNYTTHLLSEGRHKEVIPIYSPVLEAMKITGHAGETVLLCQMCNSIAQGFMQPWIPALPPPTTPATPSKDKSEKAEKTKGRQSGKGTKGGVSKGSLQTVVVDPEATPDLKQALEVIEYALNTTNGQETKNLVPISTRHPLITTWVFCKQLLNQQVPKNLGHDDEDLHSQGPMCRALCAVEMLSLQNNGLPEFTGTCPTLPETVKLVDACQWSDSLVELQMWSRLSVLAFNAENHSLVLHCGQKAVAFAESDECLVKRTPKKPDSIFQHKLVVEQEMLYYSSVVMGQSLMKNMQGKNEIRRDALVCFVNACRFGQKAGNYELVIAAARHYWNAIKPFIVEPIERELLREPMEAVLECIAAVAANEVGKEDEDDDEDTESFSEKKPSKTPVSSNGEKEKKAKDKAGDKKKDKEKDKEKEKGKTGKGGKTDKQDSKDSKLSDDKGKTGKPTAEQEDKPPPLPSAYDEDLMLRAAMYGVLFQAYADKGEWEQGLRAMDQAVKDMPRTYHRLLIFKHRVITKAKLGRNVVFDIGKFKNEKEDVIAAMWRHVALNSKASEDQLAAYQNAIEVLENPESDWQKVDYLMEFGEWLFVNEYPVADALDQFLWASDILLNKNQNRDGGQDDHSDGRSENESELDTAKYIPRERQSLIGVRPSDVTVKLEDITDIRQLETLMRIHVMLAQVAGYSSPHSRDYVLMAYAFHYRIWQVSISSAERMLKEGGKPGERSPSKKGKEKGKEAKESQGKVDKSSGKTVFPSTMEGWATFELSEKLQEYFKCDITGTMINKASFQKPMLTLYYIQALLRDLRDLGYHQLGLPVIAMQQLVADLIIDDAQLKKLVHLRAMELCQEVNLLSGVSHHEKAAGRMLLTEQEQAKSREEIEMWKEKQRQVKTEEEKTKNSKSVVFDTRTSHLVHTPHAPGSHDIIEESWNKHKREISDVCYRELWTEQAGILIRQGQFRPARQLLSEANLSARAFDDKRTLSNILLQLAVMALAEANWEQATSLLLEAQKLHGDQQFWLRTTLLLCEASFSKIDKNSTLLNTPDPSAKERARNILLRAKRVFQDLAEENPNKANMADYIEAVLEARLGTLLGHLVNDANLRKEEQAHRDLMLACKHLSHASTNLTTLGHRREAVKVMLKLAEVTRAFAEDSVIPEEKQDFLLEAFDILKEAVNLSDAVLHDVQSVSTLSELRNLSLPVQREAVDTKLVLSDLMVDVLKQFSNEARGKRELETQKGNDQKMIDDFVGVETSPTEKERKWREVTRTLAEDTMMQLSMAHGLTGNVGYLKAKTLYILGRCLGVLAAHTAPDSDTQWKEIEVSHEPEADKVAAPPDPSAEEPGPDNQDVANTETEATQNPSREFLKFANQALELKAEFTTFKRYLSQAVECLTQCVQIGLKHGFRDVVCNAAHELVESIGTHDPLTSSQYLALYQSCHMCQVLEGVLSRVQLDPSVSRQAALLHQRKLLTDMEFLNDTSCSILASNSNHLAECEAWRRLTIAKNHLELTREFSATNTQFVVLQHSPDRRYLYGAVLDKGRSPVPSGKANKQASTLPVPAKPLITRASVSAAELEQLIEEFSVFKSDTASELMRRTYVRHQQEQRRKMLAKLEDNSLRADSQELLNVDSSFAEKESQLESHFKDVVAAVEAYLDPILTKLHPALNPDAISDSVVLLADEWLLQLPLEAIKVFVVPQITSIARDFSLQFHYHRVHPAERSESTSAIKAAGKGGKKTDKGKSEKPPTAKSGQKSEKKGKELGSGVPKEGPVVDFNGIRYIVDPYNECSEEGDDNPCKVMNDVIPKFKNFTAKWTGIMGSDHLPSVGEFQRLISESTGFIFYGTERFLGCLPPNMLAPMNITDCHVVLLLDLVQTGQSFLRQGKDDATKAVGELWLERPLETAMLLSLVGVAGVVSSQWHCQLTDNKHKLDTYLTGLLETSKTVGQAVRGLVQFPKPPETAPETEASSDRGSKSGHQIDGEVTGDEQTTREKEGTGEKDDVTEQPSFSRHWFNTVLYGTPMLLLSPPK